MVLVKQKKKTGQERQEKSPAGRDLEVWADFILCSLRLSYTA